MGFALKRDYLVAIAGKAARPEANLRVWRLGVWGTMRARRQTRRRHSLSAASGRKQQMPHFVSGETASGRRLDHRGKTDYERLPLNRVGESALDHA